jgi:hypothetical protein
MRGWRLVMVTGIVMGMVGLGAAVLTGVVAPAAGAASTGRATDRQIATAGVLVAGDLPASYTQSARDTSSDAQTQKLAAKIPACTKVVAFMKLTDKNTEVKSDDFAQGQTLVDNTVTVFPTAAKAKAAVDAYAATGVPKCFGQLVGKVAQQSGGTAKADIEKVSDVTAGDQAIAYEGPVAITEADGSQATLAFGNLVIRVGRGVAVYSYNHDAQTSIQTDLRNAVESSGTRLQDALAG